MQMNTIKLSNGIKIPSLGFGPGGCGYNPHKQKPSYTQRAFDKIMRSINLNTKTEREYVNSIAEAIRLGFRLIDYSESYGDGTLLRKAIAKSGVSREQLFLTTRIKNSSQIRGSVKEDFVAQLKGMGTDYVDLLQFHWPVTDYYLKTWKEMELLQKGGLCKMLGVANCNKHHLEEILSICEIKPVVGQFEVHPLFTQKALIDYYKSQNVQVEAYTPLARHDDRLFDLPLLKNLANKYGKTIAQVILRWNIQNGCIPIVRSFNSKHQKEILDIFDFELSNEEMTSIDSININSRLRYDPDNCDFSIL